MIFSIDFDRWIAQMLPTFLRRRRLFAFCRAMCAPVKTIYAAFLTSRGDQIFNTAYNGQVCYLRAALNDAFGVIGFDITDCDDVNGEWLYAKKEDMPTQLMTVEEGLNPAPEEDSPPPDHPMPLLADELRLNAKQDTFIVYVPESIYMTQLPRVRAIVNRFKTLSKTPIYTSISNEQSRIPQDGKHRKRWQWPLPTVNPGT